MRRGWLWGLVLALVLMGGAWVHLFHGYISGNRWAWVKYRLGIYDSPIIIVGKDGWLFSRGGADDIDDYRGLAVRGNRIIRLREVLTKRHDQVRSLGGRFVDIIPPISETIYNGFLPPAYQKVGNRRRATLALEEMRGSGVETLYLADALAQAKERGRVFYKFEVHWNRFGAYMGSLAVISYLSPSYPAMKGTLARISDYQLVDGPPGTTMWNGGNSGDNLGITLLEPDPEPVPRSGWSTRVETKQFGGYHADVFSKDDKSLPSLVMFGDSFMFGMRKVMAENFRRAVFVNPWLTEAQSPLPPTFNDFPVEIIAAEKPDIVIYERWERAFLLSPNEWAEIAHLPPAQ